MIKEKKKTERRVQGKAKEEAKAKEKICNGQSAMGKKVCCSGGACPHLVYILGTWKAKAEADVQGLRHPMKAKIFRDKIFEILNLTLTSIPVMLYTDGRQ